MEQEILNRIATLLEDSIKSELLIKRPSKTYTGIPKPVRGSGPTVYANRVNTGRLYDSVAVEYVKDQNGNLKLQLGFPGAPEWRYVDQGRRGRLQGAKYPPLEAIKTWVKQRGLEQFRDRLGRYISYDQRAFLVQRSIGEYGIFPTRFIEKAFAKVEQDIFTEYRELGVQILEDLIKRKIIVTTQQNK